MRWTQTALRPQLLSCSISVKSVPENMFLVSVLVVSPLFLTPRTLPWSGHLRDTLLVPIPALASAARGKRIGCLFKVEE